jgi:hypothetical protein
VKKIRQWLKEWRVTLRIMIFDRKTYRQLTGPLNPDDFIEVPRPGSEQ